MALTSAHVLFALLSLVAVAVPILASGRGAIVGGWHQIEKPNDNKGAVAAAKFAVEEYNKQQNKSLIFVSIVKAESQVVAGTKYRFTLSAKDGKPTAAPYNYNAVVWYKVVGKTLQLLSFEKEIKA